MKQSRAPLRAARRPTKGPLLASDATVSRMSRWRFSVDDLFPGPWHIAAFSALMFFFISTAVAIRDRTPTALVIGIFGASVFGLIAIEKRAHRAARIEARRAEPRKA